MGLQINWDKIPGLKVSVSKNGACSNYTYATVDSTWEAIRNFRGGNAVFTNPSGAVKCGGAPQKIMYLADDRFREAGVRDKTQIIFASALPNIFAVEPYRAMLEQVVARKQIDCRFRHELIEIRPESKEAVFKNLDTQEQHNFRVPFQAPARTLWGTADSIWRKPPSECNHGLRAKRPGRSSTHTKTARSRPTAVQ